MRSPSTADTHAPASCHPAADPDHDQDAEGESEAETVVLSRDEKPVDAVDDDTTKLIKTERLDDDHDAHHHNNNNHENAVNTDTDMDDAKRLHTSNGHHVKVNGTSTSTSHAARHTKDGSSQNSAKSPAPSALSPTQTTTRGRSASTVENRKRKLRDDSFPKSFEPPRQKARTECLKDTPNSPATPAFGRPHKRSQSTQSTISAMAARKRRDVTNLALSTEADEHWAGSSSDHSTSPQPTSAPYLQQHARVKRSSHRALTSPARTMPQRKIDRFGATRLARESEKGDLDAVKEAYEEAPDELDQADYAGIAPLQKAALHGWAPVVRYLINKGCRTDCESHDRDTPLIDAVENSHLDVVRLLLNQGKVNPHHSNKKGQRAIDVLDPEDEDAAEIEKELKEAMKRRVDTSTNDHERSQKQAKTASRLLYNEFNVETLIEKAGDGDILAVGELINSNIKPNITCGVAAARGGHYDILSILLASGLKADPDPASSMRMKRRSPPRRERSSSPRTEPKRAHLAKSTTAHAVPQKSRRLMSGKEKATREGQRRKRVVDEDSSEEESEEDVRPPTRKTKHRSYSEGEGEGEGEEVKPVRKALKARSDDNEPKRPACARSDESDDAHSSTKHPVKTRTKPSKPPNAKPTPEVDSPDERKVVKNKIKYKTIEDKLRKRRLSDVSADDASVKRTPTASNKSTPAPPERIATPEVERARRQEEQRAQVEAKRKAAQAAAEAEARKKEAEEAARKAADEEEARKKAEADAEAQRQAEKAEAARIREEQENQRRAEEEAKKQRELQARQDRISRLPRALRRACELGTKRPLHFSGEELGVSAVFLPLFFANAQDLQDPQALPNKTYVCSFQIVGILGLEELDLARLSAPYSDWPRIPVSRTQRDAILRQYDVALLAQDFRFPMEGAPDFDYAKIQDSIKEAKNQFSAMEGMYWIEESLLHAEVEKIDSLRPLLPDMRAQCKRRRINLVDSSDEWTEKKQKPRKSFMDMVLAQNGINGAAAPTVVNGNG
ncbi:ankyrin repeat [Pyrenophora seminiperda CCB06]|uniref:Ankyrin repeat n=1 Tax=Pyrenophora seminiperda CCB06 TaxID=1302712 RepID=A0A3M7LW29_9PLEO|nr:ankyrin repeat [Pyrenophora seminiperda CCB06]